MFEVKNECGFKVWLRPADVADVRLFFGWRSDPWIISKGKSGRSVPWEEHSDWFEKAVSEEHRRIYVTLVDHQPSGAVFFHREENVISISLYLVKDMTGKGIGAPVISAACQKVAVEWPSATEVRAEILSENRPSLRVFEKAGFEELSNDAGTSIFRWMPNRDNEAKVCIPHNRPVFDQAEISAAADAAASGMWVNGSWTRALEERMSAWKNQPALAVDSGYSALKMALRALELPAGAEVLVPAYSCVALPNAVLSVGAIPIPVDVEADSGNLSVAAAKSAVTERTAASIAVNTFGRTSDWRELKDATDAPVIEDGSHGFSIGGSLTGDLAIMSLYATKLLGCGEGGVVWLANQQQAEIVADLRSYTDKMPSASRENALLSEMEAAIAYRQMDKLEGHIDARRKLAEAYSEALGSLAGHGTFSLPTILNDEICYRYVLNCASAEVCDRIQSALAREGVTAERPVEPWLSEQAMKSFPCAAQHYAVNLSLPVFPSLEIVAIEQISGVIESAIKS